MILIALILGFIIVISLLFFLYGFLYTEVPQNNQSNKDREKSQQQIDKENNYEDNVKQILGKSISEVRYYEAKKSEGYEYLRNENNEYDAPTFGLDLRMSSGEIFSITYSFNIQPEGLYFRNESLSHYNENHDTINVTNISHWKKFIGKEIKNVTIQRLDSYITSLPGEIGCIEYVSIQFSGGDEVLIGSYEERDGALVGSYDELVIIFDKKVASKYGVL